MKDEQAFRKLMIQARVFSKKQENYISREKVNELFAEMQLTQEQLLLVCKYLTEGNVTVFEDEAAYEAHVREVLREKNTDASERSPEPLNRYLEDLDKLEEISKEERLLRVGEVLLKKETAQKVIPPLYLREVVDVARLYEGQGVEAEDLIGEGNISLLIGSKMLECCESAQEAEDFLLKMIMDGMESLIMEKSSDEELDLRILEKVNELNEKAKELAETLEREVTLEELAAELDTDIEELNETMRLSGNAIAYIAHEHKHETASGQEI
ncbi:MAG: sigma-70 domain-containing protein [Lachnospiraceae bacterium]